MRSSIIIIMLRKKRKDFNLIEGIYMNKKDSDKIKNAIDMCRIRMQAFSPYLNEDKPLLNEKYNKLLIEKAVLRDKLVRSKKPFLVKLAEKIRYKAKRGLISDYFA